MKIEEKITLTSPQNLFSLFPLRGYFVDIDDLYNVFS